jgi:protein-ribulosamine 3-kinase
VKFPIDISEYIQDHFGEIVGLQRVNGGDINESALVRLENDQSMFVKWILKAPPDFLEKEAEGLRALRAAASPLIIPEVYAVQVFESGTQTLIMDYLNPIEPSATDWVKAGEGLAMLHSNTSDTFGWTSNNYIGTLPQENTESDSWPIFFGLERLRQQLFLGLRRGVFGAAFAKGLDRLVAILPSLLPNVAPELTHGDLWSGNILFTSKGPALIDPSVAYAHGEADLAMSKLFGGFPPTFYDAYQQSRPLVPGWESRMQLLQLYWVMVHANLFGGHYVQQCQSIVDRYVR